MVLPEQCQRHDLGSHDRHQVGAVAVVILRQELQVLEVIGIQLALVQSLVRGVVIRERLDIDVIACVLCFLLERYPSLLCVIGGADFDGLGVIGVGRACHQAGGGDGYGGGSSHYATDLHGESPSCRS